MLHAPAHLSARVHVGSVHAKESAYKRLKTSCTSDMATHVKELLDQDRSSSCLDIDMSSGTGHPHSARRVQNSSNLRLVEKTLSAPLRWCRWTGKRSRRLESRTESKHRRWATGPKPSSLGASAVASLRFASLCFALLCLRLDSFPARCQQSPLIWPPSVSGPGGHRPVLP